MLFVATDLRTINCWLVAKKLSLSNRSSSKRGLLQSNSPRSNRPKTVKTQSKLSFSDYFRRPTNGWVNIGMAASLTPRVIFRALNRKYLLKALQCRPQW